MYVPASARTVPQPRIDEPGRQRVAPVKEDDRLADKAVGEVLGDVRATADIESYRLIPCRNHLRVTVK